jgi:putative transposase
VRFPRKVLAQVPQGSSATVAAAIRTIFALSDAEMVRDLILGDRGHARPTVAAGRDDGARHRGLLAFAAFPVGHWREIWSTNPLERLNGELTRRTDDVGVFPNPDALFRLAGSVLVEAHGE